MDMQGLWSGFEAAMVQYGPNIIKALIILVIAYFVAKVISWVLKTVIEKSGMGDADSRSELKSGVSSAAFWVVMLIALPLILEPLGMKNILEPLQNMVDKFLAFLPNLVGAAVIFGIGYIVATVARKAVSGVLTAAKADDWASSAGIGQVEVSKTLGTLVFVLLIVPIAIAALDALQMEAVSAPAKAMLQTMLDAVPNIVGAGIIVGLAFLIGRFASGMLEALLPSLGIDTVGEKVGLKSEMNGMSVSDIAAKIAFAAIMVFGVIEAAKILNFAILSEMMAEILSLGGRVLLGAVIIGFGVFAANAIAGVVGSTKSGAKIAGLLKVAIIILASAMGLRQMGIANEIITMGFTLMMGALAVGAAIAIGWGGKDTAKRMLDKWSKQF